MTHGSLFSGIGGFDLAAKSAGFTNIFTCEIDAFCRKVLTYYFQNSIHYEDIKKTNFKPFRGLIDILTGGFPCQPFSVSGKRNGAEDDRYLWPQMLRVIREIRPTWVVAENVNGIISMVQPGCEIEVESQAFIFEEDYKETILKQEYIIETICGDFEREGYTVQPVVIPACAVGAPHRRDRVWFIAHHNGNDSGRHRHEEAFGTNGTSQSERSFTSNRTAFCFGSKRSSSDTNKLNGDLSGFHPSEISQFESPGIQENTFKYTDCQRCKKQHALSVTDEKKRISSFGYIKDWTNWPTQSPVLSRNDGISSRLDGITFSKWRNESIKSYGNAIVPQVAYEIFKSIKYIHNLK